MSAAQVLREARAVGIHLAVEGEDLLLEASAPPPSAVLEALSRHKNEILAMLRRGHNRWSTEDWRLFFEERAAIAEFDGGLPRNKAEAQAFECCIVEWLNRNPASSKPGRCAWCGRSESQDAIVLPFGTEPGIHVWLHAQRWTEWQKMRRSHAEETLNQMDLVNSSDGRTHASP